MKALPIAVLIAVALTLGACGGSSSPSPSPLPSRATPTPQASRLVDIVTYHHVGNAVLNDPDVRYHVTYTDLDEIGNKVVVGIDTEEAREAAERSVEKLNLAPGSVEFVIEPFAEED